MKSVASFTAAVALLSGTTNAFWRMPCRERIGLMRLDPIVDPGTASSHGHTLHGGSNLQEETTYEMLRDSNCTSCQFEDDKSAYWTPSLHFIHENGKTEVVEQIGGMLAYYLLLGKDIKAFPKGFRMLAGDSRLRNFTGAVPDPPLAAWTEEDLTQFSLGQKSLGFNCLHYKKPAEGARYRHFLPTKDYMDENCADGIRAEIFFPSCWNGKDVDSDNHKDHMAYPNMIDGGVCPEGFDTRLPSLFYETIWNTQAFKDFPGQFVWSNGDPTGYGYHADFINGWDIDTLQSAVETCTDPSGKTEDCPVFSGALLSEPEMMQCKIESQPKILSNDDCAGPADGLCGNVPVQYGPAYAAALKPGDHAEPTVKPTLASSAAPVPTLSYASARSKGATDAYGGGISVYNVEETPAMPTLTSTSVSTSTSVEAEAETPAVTAAALADDAISSDDGIVSTSTYTSEGIVYEVAIKEIAVTVTVEAKRRRHAHMHRRDREHGLLGRH
ncbi:WSC domain-containing protein [Decorospora gaudefroyi]|uniref:WSC domain-containing protein n=1 Tax=Decorospora gaudefroyi TaxID=184978 RepID=A0A6A5K2G2_9PLEO|nr:WSC domain-containing protein [Decorospora gaudefroyi]